MAGSSGGGSRGLISRVRLVHLCRQGDRTRCTAWLVCRQGSDLALWAGRSPFLCLEASRFYLRVPGSSR
jgi:hypothetical protein